MRRLDQISKSLGLAEKVAISSQAISTPSLIDDAAKHFGSQSVVAVVDVELTNSGDYGVTIMNSTVKTGRHSRRMGSRIAR